MSPRSTVPEFSVVALDAVVDGIRAFAESAPWDGGTAEELLIGFVTAWTPEVDELFETWLRVTGTALPHDAVAHAYVRRARATGLDWLVDRVALLRARGVVGPHVDPEESAARILLAFESSLYSGRRADREARRAMVMRGVAEQLQRCARPAPLRQAV
ncbi:MAG: hypothetical protein J7513_15315 [Solirubrobacteraceae bacterium]|nr:hypothetical protein [Solirubrobacteraceae bacterium]